MFLIAGASMDSLTPYVILFAVLAIAFNMIGDAFKSFEASARRKRDDKPSAWFLERRRVIEGLGKPVRREAGPANRKTGRSV